MQLPVFANQYHTENHCIVQGGNASVLYKGCCGAKPTSCSAAQLAQHFYRTSGKLFTRLRARPFERPRCFFNEHLKHIGRARSRESPVTGVS